MLPVCSALIALIVIIVFLVLFGLKKNHQNQHSTNSICDALSTADHHLSQPSLLHLNNCQQQNALQHVTHYTLSHHANHQNGNGGGGGQLTKNDPVLNGMLNSNMLISNGTNNNKLIYEANLNQSSNNAALHLQNTNDSIANSIYCPSPYATRQISYFFQDNPITNPISNCFLSMNTPNELANNSLNQKTIQKNCNLNHENCYDLPTLKVGLNF